MKYTKVSYIPLEQTILSSFHKNLISLEVHTHIMSVIKNLIHNYISTKETFYAGRGKLRELKCLLLSISLELAPSILQKGLLMLRELTSIFIYCPN